MKVMKVRVGPSLLLAAASVTGAGCSSISDSANGLSTSISGFIGGTSESLGSSAVVPSRERRYLEDVRLAARSLVEEGRAGDAFLRELGRIAERHGVTDWEAEPVTFLALGAGLREAGVPESELDGVLGGIGQAHPSGRALAREGHRSPRL